ncbi:MAG: hypothetical protein QME74_09810, partial [Candidatus Edwardsbacteria bacterium]|nr:hypothetical protein [Candidatus Edwardsbacteria bacterium]
AGRQWYELQESTAKTLNAIDKQNLKGLPLLLFDAYRHMLKLLALLNQRPYTTYPRFIAEAERFKLQPPSFKTLTGIIVNGKYQDLSRLKKIITRVFDEFEAMLEQSGIDPYYDEVDPNIPMKRGLRRRS